MKKLVLLFIATIGAVSLSHAQVLTGVFNSGRDEESDAVTTMDMEFHACDYDPTLTCGTALRSVLPNGETNEGVMLSPSENFDPNNGQDFEMAGAVILRGLQYNGKRSGLMRWKGGLFYNPATGDEFDGVFVHELENGNLAVGGCVLIFCQESTFTRID